MHDLVLVRNEPAGTGLRRLVFDRGLEGFDRPGQFVTVHLPDLPPGYFALASVPGAPVELLVKVHGEVAEALVAREPGATVRLSDPIGKGFALPPGDTRPLVILATGSGISAVRSVVEAEVDAGLPRPVTLLYGVYTPDHRSYVDRLDAWRSAGVDVVEVVSEEVPGWRGDRGFVQSVAAARGLVRDDVTVVLCGYPAMVEEAKALYAEAGLAPDRVLTNF